MYDHYEVARRIAASLQSEGFSEASQSLLDAMACGSTGTEIVMALRWNLEQLLKADGLRDDTRILMKELRDELNKQLGR